MHFCYLQNFAKEILAESRSELDMGGITAVVVKAGGANYGSGKWNHPSIFVLLVDVWHVSV